MEKEKKPKPTYVGKNESLVFVAPTQLFTMKMKADENIEPEALKTFSNHLSGTFKGFNIANKTKYDNKDNSKIETTPEFWEKFENLAKRKDIDLIGYTPVLESYIFKGLPIVGKNAIVLGMEMKWDKVKTAPSFHCNTEAFRVYDVLGIKTIELTRCLQDRGYKSEAHHPFGGKLLFPPHAKATQLGFMGKNGLIITPEFGPRQRWSIITTDADIPEVEQRDFSEMEEFCETCRACIKNCYGGAAYEEGIEKIEGSGIITHIDRSKCIQSIIENNYCSNCLKVCPQGKKV